MFVFGHLGFGHQLAAPWRRTLPRWPLAFGMLLPDLIDKPLYYARVSDFISCTRTFGHTGLLCLAIFGVGYLLRNRAWIAVSLGMVTHFALDLAMDMLPGGEGAIDGQSALRIALTWPLHGGHFVQRYVSSIGEHTGMLLNVPMILAELVGIVLLLRTFRRDART
jgi:hypothetical protein